MSEDQADAREPSPRPEPARDYGAPALSDLGSFEELTELSNTGQVDQEGAS